MACVLWKQGCRYFALPSSLPADQSARRVRGANVGVSVALALLLLVSLLHMRSVATDSSHCGRCFFYLFVRMHGAESKPVALCFSSRDALCLRQNKAIHSYICIAFCVAATRSIIQASQVKSCMRIICASFALYVFSAACFQLNHTITFCSVGCLVFQWRSNTSRRK